MSTWEAAPANREGPARPVLNPADHRDVVGMVIEASPEAATLAVTRAARSTWGETPVSERAAILAHPSAVGVSLGPRILRAETAALAAVAVWMAGQA